MSISVLQVLPELESGGVERGTIEVAKALIDAGHHALVISGGGQMVRELEQIGAKHLLVSVGRKNPLTFRHVLTLRRFLLQNDIDIIDVRSRLPAWVVLYTLKLIPRKKRPVLITSVHGAYSVSHYSAIMMRGDCIVAVSKFIKQYIIQNYPWVDENKITVIPRGISSKKYFREYKPDAEWVRNWKAEQPQLVSNFVITLPGRITEIKGQQDFLLVINELQQRGLKVHGLVAGGAGTKKQAFFSRLKEQCRILGLEQFVTFLGDRRDLREIMSFSDMVLSLSKKPESFGRTIIEALALGRPVLAYDHGGASEILESCFPAGKVKANDWMSMSDHIESFIKDPSARPGECIFTLESMLEKTLRLYQQCYAERLKN